MLLSMTGHGSAVARDDQVQVLAEVRSVNNRFLKVGVSSDLDAAHQSRLESMVRGRIRRGSVNVKIQTQFLAADSQYRINVPQVQAYQHQLASADKLGAIDLNALLLLPGVVVESMENNQLESAWPAIESAMRQALDRLVEMRTEEGQALLHDLLGNCDLLSRHAERIAALSPRVVEGYAKRVTERINRLLEEHEVAVTNSDIVREVGIFAERADIAEELVRLASHLDQFRSVAASTVVSDGRKLDFLTQELLRETNTIGSKANDAEIASQVVEMKAIIERIREMTQNIE